MAPAAGQRGAIHHLELWVPDLDRARRSWGWLLNELVAAAPEHGWRLLFADRHPHAGGPEHYAAYLEDADGYEVELVADLAA